MFHAADSNKAAAQQVQELSAQLEEARRAEEQAEAGAAEQRRAAAAAREELAVAEAKLGEARSEAARLEAQVAEERRARKERLAQYEGAVDEVAALRQQVRIKHRVNLPSVSRPSRLSFKFKKGNYGSSQCLLPTSCPAQCVMHTTTPALPMPPCLVRAPLDERFRCMCAIFDRSTPWRRATTRCLAR